MYYYLPSKLDVTYISSLSSNVQTIQHNPSCVMKCLRYIYIYTALNHFLGTKKEKCKQFLCMLFFWGGTCTDAK